MMSIKIKYVLLLLPMLLGVGSSYAQEKEKNHQKENTDIVISKDDFIDVLAKAVIERKKNDPNFDVENFRRYLLQQRGNNANSYNSRFDKLEEQVRELMLILLAGKCNANGSSTHIPAYLPHTSNVSLNKTKDTTIVNMDTSGLESEINKLATETENLRTKLDEKKEAQPQRSAYDGNVSQIFFANNKDDLSTESIAAIDRIVAILKQNPKLDIMVKGFASKVGSPLYNQTLSLKRADNVKRAFIVRGIAPGRVLTTYHGEDLSNVSDKEARRVDVIILDTTK